MNVSFLKFALCLFVLIGCGFLVLLGALSMFGSAFFEKAPTFYEALGHLGLFCVGFLSFAAGLWLGRKVIARAVGFAP